jgi:hypothetical protein
MAQQRADTLRTASIGANARAASAALTVSRENLSQQAWEGWAEQSVARQNVINNASDYINLTNEELEEL